MSDCILCGIVAGDIPSHQVWSDDDFMAVLDIAPASPGHTLVVPRSHHETLLDLPPDTAAGLARAIQVVGRSLLDADLGDGFNVVVNVGEAAGMSIPHVHAHLVPRKPGDGAFHHPGGGEYGDGEAESVAERIRSARDDG